MIAVQRARITGFFADRHIMTIIGRFPPAEAPDERRSEFDE